MLEGGWEGMMGVGGSNRDPVSKNAHRGTSSSSHYTSQKTQKLKLMPERHSRSMLSSNKHPRGPIPSTLVS